MGGCYQRLAILLVFLQSGKAIPRHFIQKITESLFDDFWSTVSSLVCGFLHFTTLNWDKALGINLENTGITGCIYKHQHVVQIMSLTCIIVGIKHSIIN